MIITILGTDDSNHRVLAMRRKDCLGNPKEHQHLREIQTKMKLAKRLRRMNQRHRKIVSWKSSEKRSGPYFKVHSESTFSERHKSRS